MIYLSILLSNKEKILIKDEELGNVISAIGRGDKVIITSGGIFNSSFYVSIVIDKDKMSEIRERTRFGMARDEEVSDFAKLLSKKLPQLNSVARIVPEKLNG